MMPLKLSNLITFCGFQVGINSKSQPGFCQGQLHLAARCKQRANGAAQVKSTEVKPLLAAAPLQDKDPTRGLQIPSRLLNASRRLTCK